MGRTVRFLERFQINVQKERAAKFFVTKKTLAYQKAFRRYDGPLRSPRIGRRWCTHSEGNGSDMSFDTVETFTDVRAGDLSPAHDVGRAVLCPPCFLDGQFPTFSSHPPSLSHWEGPLAEISMRMYLPLVLSGSLPLTKVPLC